MYHINRYKEHQDTSLLKQFTVRYNSYTFKKIKLNPLVRSLHRPIPPRQGEEDREENA